jgi:hypothetical protein
MFSPRQKVVRTLQVRRVGRPEGLHYIEMKDLRRDKRLGSHDVSPAGRCEDQRVDKFFEGTARQVGSSMVRDGRYAADHGVRSRPITWIDRSGRLVRNAA